jgi:hypothetical protein
MPLIRFIGRFAMTTRTALHRTAPLLLLASILSTTRAGSAYPQASHQTGHADIPSSIRADHHEVREALQRATKLGGRTGVAARALDAVLQPHFVREEQIALPPLSMLAPLVRSEHARVPGWLLPMTDSLRRELPQMLREHVAIRAATQRLAREARAEGQSAVARLTDELALHALSEEEVLYPAAILVGDLVRARSGPR